MESLQEFRQEIDQIDADMLQLIKKRFDVVKKVGIYKAEHNLPALQQNRWEEVLRKITSQGNALGLNTTYIKNIWNMIHEYALEEEEKSIR